MTNLPQKYQNVAKELIPYTATDTDSTGQMALIKINPALPCFLCNRPAHEALLAPTPDRFPGGGHSWITFPICADCEARQIGS
jgi:hypothetical protein